MFTAAVTAFGAQVTPPASLSPSLPAIAQTTLVRELRRDYPPEVLTNAQTCGYTSGAWSSAVTCSPQHSCTYYSGPYSAPNFGCCDSNGQGCGYVSTCLDYRAKGNYNTFGGVAILSESFLCGSALPYCSTLLLYGTTWAPGSTYSFYYYSCQATRAPAVIAYQTTFNERDDTSSSTTTSSSSSTETTNSSSMSITSSNTSSTSSTVSSTQTSAANSPQSTQLVSSNASPSTKADVASSSPHSASSTITSSSATSTNQASTNSLSQTSQIGIAVGVSIGVCVLLASFALWFMRYRKARIDKRWLNQPSQPFPPYLHHEDSTKAVHPFDYRSGSFRTELSGKSASEAEAPYELASTGRSHELAAGNR